MIQPLEEMGNRKAYEAVPQDVAARSGKGRHCALGEGPLCRESLDPLPSLGSAESCPPYSGV